MDYITKKVVFFGDPDSGKTHLLISTRFNKSNEGGTFPSEWVYTTEANGKKVQLILYDTNKHLDRLFPLYFSGCDIVVLCFSIDEPDSLTNVEEFWLPLIRQHLPKIPIILLANKVDLRSDPATIVKLWNLGKLPVSNEDGHNMATKIGARCYFECSTVTKANIDEVVRSITEIATMDSASEPEGKTGVIPNQRKLLSNNKKFKLFR